MARLDHFYLILATLSWGRAIILSSILGLLYWFLAYNDGAAIQASYEQTRQQVAQMEQQVKSTREAMANADRFEREVKSVVDQFNKVVEMMPDKLSSAEMTTIISDAVSKAGLKLIRTEPKSGTEKTESFESLKMGLQVEGHFNQILVFLSQLTKIPKIMTFDHIELSTSTSTDPENPMLQLTATIVGYRYLKSVERQAPDKNAKPAGPAKQGAGK